MPFDVGDLGFLPPDAVEFVAVFVTMGLTYAVLIALGYWWAR